VSFSIPVRLKQKRFFASVSGLSMLSVITPVVVRPSDDHSVPHDIPARYAFALKGAVDDTISIMSLCLGLSAISTAV
jgi:hypothetical protein